MNVHIRALDLHIGLHSLSAGHFQLPAPKVKVRVLDQGYRHLVLQYYRHWGGLTFVPSCLVVKSSVCDCFHLHCVVWMITEMHVGCVADLKAHLTIQRIHSISVTLWMADLAMKTLLIDTYQLLAHSQAAVTHHFAGCCHWSIAVVYCQNFFTFTLVHMCST